MKPFQIFVLGLFGFFAIVGVIVFATFRGPNAGIEEIPVTLWGTLPTEEFVEALGAYNGDAEEQLSVVYRELSRSELDSEFAEAGAEGRGPDLLLVPHDAILEQQAKLSVLPFESFPERDFKDTFVELGELFVVPEGIVGLPLSIDPLVLYWNRDILASEGYALPPKTWEELVVMTPKLTERDEANSIVRSAIAFGGFQNVDHAGEVLTLLFMQAGDPIVVRGADGRLSVSFGERFDLPEVPAESALRFYTEFADPVKPLYSWNRSLPSAKDAFLAGDLALYLGFASEARELALRNPNLNFDVALVPQVDGSPLQQTYGAIAALALLRPSPSTSAALRAMALITHPT